MTAPLSLEFLQINSHRGANRDPVAVSVVKGRDVIEIIPFDVVNDEFNNDKSRPLAPASAFEAVKSAFTAAANDTEVKTLEQLRTAAHKGLPKAIDDTRLVLRASAVTAAQA